MTCPSIQPGSVDGVRGEARGYVRRAGVITRTKGIGVVCIGRRTDRSQANRAGIESDSVPGGGWNNGYISISRGQPTRTVKSCRPQSRQTGSCSCNTLDLWSHFKLGDVSRKGVDAHNHKSILLFCLMSQKLMFVF